VIAIETGTTFTDLPLVEDVVRKRLSVKPRTHDGHLRITADIRVDV
jgi:hypothetical protein